MSMLSTSKNRTASRSLSQNTQNNGSVDELKVDLAFDVRRSQDCDFELFLQANLSFILKEDSKEKKDLDELQKLIEKLELKIDAGVRAKAAQHVTEGEGSNEDDPDMAQRKNDLEKLRTTRQGILYRLYDELLDAVLPICSDRKLLDYLTEYSNSKSDVPLYAPFVNSCNHALDRLGGLSPDAFLCTSSLDCRFHVNDPKHIVTDYGDSSVHTKPNVIVTSKVVTEDTKNTSDSSPNQMPKYDAAPKDNFKMPQILGAVELKRTSCELTTPLTNYSKIRKEFHGWKDNDLSVLYPIDGSTPAVLNTEEQRAKLTSAAGPSNTRSGGSKTEKGQGGSKPKASGSEKKSDTETAHYPPINSKDAINARMQCATYGMEMLSYALGVHHAIVILIIDCKLWVCYYDRQGVIQSNGIDFVKDLPLFLILLFILQRFELTEWGVIPELNPNATMAHIKEPQLSAWTRSAQKDRDAALARAEVISNCTLERKHFDSNSFGSPVSNEDLKIQIDLEDWLSHQPYCLAGRATAVVGSSNPGGPIPGELACKISFPEVTRENEGKLIDELRQEIEKDDRTRHFSKHLPTVIMYGDMIRYGTQRIRSMLMLSTQGCRTLRTLITNKLKPLTFVAGAEFVKAWLEVVTFHAFLWSRKLEHGDPSLWNTMFNKDLRCGVLGDFDLSISRGKPRVPGTDRMGTVPFMALELLTDRYWNGEVERKYRHELEALIWILPFAFLRYQDGKSQSGTPVDSWMTADHRTCLKEKAAFRVPIMQTAMQKQCQSDFKDHWKLAHWLTSWLVKIDTDALDRQSEEMGETDDSDDLTSIWPLFVGRLRFAAKRDRPQLDYIDKLVDELGLESPIWVPNT